MSAALEEHQSPLAVPVADVLATVPEWWSRRARAAGLDEQWRDWRLALESPPFALDGSPRPDLYEADPFTFGDAYTAALDAPVRLREGRHYTPASLSHALWEEIGTAGGELGEVVDPACGAGSLLLQPLRRAIADSGDPAKLLALLPSVLHGTDLDACAVWLGNALLSAELLPIWGALDPQRRAPLPRLLSIGDGLTSIPSTTRVVVMNPPYGRIRLDMAGRRRWRETLYGHANLYALFLHAAIERVETDGLVAAIVPTSFLGGAYYQRLREFMSRHAPLERITFVDSRSGVFAGDVLQETCLALFRKADAPVRVVCRTLQPTSGRRSSPLSVFAPEGARPWLLPRVRSDEPLVRHAKATAGTLVSHGWRVSTGPLVWNRHKAQISSTESDGSVPIIWGADIREDGIRRSPARDPQRWIDLRAKDAFMKLGEPAVLVQRTTAPEQPRRILAALLDQRTLDEWGGSVVVENHVNVLRRVQSIGPLTPRLLSRLLATQTFDRIYRCMTGTVAVSAYELEALPFPPDDVLADWQTLGRKALAEAVARYFGDAAP